MGGTQGEIAEAHQRSGGRRKGENPNEDNVLNIQLAVFIDSSLVYHFHQRNPKEPMAKIDQVMRNMTEMLVNSVELQLNHHTLGQDFSIEIVHFEHGFSVPAPQETSLEQFCLWQKQRKITCQCHWDYALLLTGPGIYSQRRYVPVRSCSISTSSLLAWRSPRRTWIKLV